MVFEDVEAVADLVANVACGLFEDVLGGVGVGALRVADVRGEVATGSSVFF
jgi:hypothetical protein